MMKSMRDAYGDALVELEDDKIVVLDADLASATMSSIFAKRFPERFFNVGIAEQNLYGVATGMANSGLTVFASTFALFASGRAYEIVRNSIAYSNANVKIVGTHAGLSPHSDGGSHQAIEDLALMRVLPNMTVLSPCDYNQAKELIKKASQLKTPVYIRLGRLPSPVFTDGDVELGKAQVLRDGTDICIISTGAMVYNSLEAAKELEEQGKSVAVINMHTIKPFDNETVLQYVKKCGAVLTVEEHSVIGGLGSAVSDVIAGKGKFEFKKLGVEDVFGQSGDLGELMTEYGLTTENIVKLCLEVVRLHAGQLI